MDLRAMAIAHVAARAIHVTVELGIADQLAVGPLTCEALADRLALDPAGLDRLLRFLLAQELVEVQSGERFALTSEGGQLVDGHEGGVAGAIRAMARPGMWEATGDLARAVRTGGPTLARGGRPLYDAMPPAEAAYLSETMLGFHGHEPPAVLRTYDFGSRSCVVDVGGSTGNLLAMILRSHPALRGILFDLPAVAAQAQSRMREAGVLDRTSVVAGSFFDEVPAGGDTYVLSHVLHDWSDEDAARILASCRRAMAPGDHLLIVEEVAAPDAPSAAILDLILLTTTRGRSRTQPEHAALLRRAGFEFEAALPTDGLITVLLACAHG